MVQQQVLDSLEHREAQWDKTVWLDEILSQRYELAFVKLRDELIRATNKVAVLAGFDFGEIAVPSPKGTVSPLDLGIGLQEFDDARTTTLSQRTWKENLMRLGDTGWKLDQVEWNHVRFVPPRNNQSAISDFVFELHGERVGVGSRFIVRGNLRIEWEKPGEGGSRIKPQSLKVSDLRVWERLGSPGFKKLMVVTPEAPEQQGVFVNMHPLIVTDLNGDQKEDIILAGANRLFVNLGDARFEPHEFIAEREFHGVRSAGVVADFTGDGFIDFLTVASEGVWSNKLVVYKGTGSVTFTQVAEITCSSLVLQDPSVMTVGDIDKDGDLDVWLAQYKPPYVGGQMPTPYYDANDGYPSYLLLNDGHGKFTVGNAAAGLTAKNRRRTYAASFADLDDDGDLDLVTVNDFAGVDLYYNDGKGVFADETARLYNKHLFGMSHGLSDFDRDGVLDLLVIGMNLPTVQRLESLGIGRPDAPERNRKRVDMAYGNRLYLRRAERWAKPDFGDQIAQTGWTWGNTVFDLANDGNLDIYLANGHISGESSADYDSHYWRHDIYVGSSREDRRLLYYFAQPFQGINTGKTSWNGFQHNVLFFDFGSNHYANIAFLMDVAHESDCRAVVSADLNNDGRMDLVMTEAQWMGNPVTGRHRLLVHLNELRSEGNWIGAKLATRQGRSSPIGAKVVARSNDRTWVAQVVTGSSFQAQHPNTVHFGLGKVNQLTELSVTWPDGQKQVIKHPPVNKYYHF